MPTEAVSTASVVLLAMLAVLAGGLGSGPVPAGAHRCAPATASSEVLSEPRTGGTSDPVAVALHPSTASSGVGRLFVTTPDPTVVPNDGLRTNITAFLPGVFDPFTSYQEGAAETIGGYDAVFGIFENDKTPPVAFFSVFSNTTDQTIHLAYWTDEALITGQTYDFELSRTNGTVWNLTVNGLLFGGNASLGSFDFGSTESTWAGGLSFSEIALYTNATTAPASAPVPLAFAVHHPSGWYLPEPGIATFSGSAPWGVEGRLQHPSLPPGAVVSGSGVAAVPNGTTLWNTGPVPVDVTIDLVTTAVGLTTVELGANVTDPAGAPIAGVAVYFADALGGNFTPASTLTGAAGTVESAWSTPNVTANASDLVTARVTNFGYSGFVSLAVSVRPALHVLVTADGPVGLPPGGSTTVVLLASDPGGNPVGGVYLSVTSVTGTLGSGQVLTDASGHAPIEVSTTQRTGEVSLVVTVVGSGVWGVARIVVPVQASSSWLIPLAVGGGLVAAGAVGAVWWWRRSRRPRPTAEQLWGPSLRRPKPPVSRTPPGPGAP